MVNIRSILNIWLFSFLDQSNTSDGNVQVDSENSKNRLVRGNQSKQDVLIKTGEMTPFGGTVQSIKEGKKLQDVVTSLISNSFSDQKDEKEQDQNNEAHGEQEKSLARFVTENLEDDDDLYDDEYVPDENELKYSWYEDADEEGLEGEPTKAGKQAATAKRRSLNVAYREEDSPKPKKKKRTNKTVRRGDRKPVDDGSEKIYRKRMR